jgi:alpha-L-fucosidase
LPPDRRGRIHENDVAALREFRRVLDATFARDLARDASATASNVRGNARRYQSDRLLDDRRDTYWATDDSVRTAEVILDLRRPATFNVVRLREYLPLGQRVDGFALDRWDAGTWVEFARGTSIGNQRLLRTSRITGAKIRLRITGASAGPALSELGLYLEPAGSTPRSSKP